MKKSTIVKNTLHTATRQHKRALALFAVTLLAAVYTAPVAMAVTLTSASLKLADPRPSATNVKYTFQASSVSTSATRCIKFVFSTTVAGTTVPSNMSTAAAALDTTNTNYVPTPANWTTDGSTTNGTVTIVNATGETPASSTSRIIAIDGITNSDTADVTYFAKITTYGNQDCSTSPIDNSTIAFIVTNGQAVTMTVDPTLTFSIAGTTAGATCNGATSNVETTATTVPLGSLTTSANNIGSQDLTVSTNAGTGYTVAARYTGKPTFGTNDIDDHTGTNAAPTLFSGPGTEAYGYTTNDSTLGTGTADRFTSSGGNKWAAFTTTDAEIAYSSNGVTAETTCIAHQAGVAALTAAGSYATSAIYTATPIY